MGAKLKTPSPAEARARKHAFRAVSPGKEQRTLTGQVEIREGTTNGGMHLTGYASVTNTPYPIQDFFDEYMETVRTGAFGKSIAAGDDVRLLLNHDGAPLARTKSQTMTLVEDSTGLLVDAPDLDAGSPLVQTIRSAMTRGDLDEMSFGFQVLQQNWSPDYAQRDILEVKLFDVSVVTFPANDATTVALRSALQSASPGIVRQIGRPRVAAALADVLRIGALPEEKRVGAVLSADSLSVLQDVLNLIATADDAVDAAQPVLAGLMGVPNPDDDDDSDTDEDLDDVPVVEPGGESDSARAHQHMLLQRRALEDELTA